ncbi:helix-turn-helix domain-containing protein [Patescibacteria group bacterium]|nr:helix-turn-helix domain-containing protein [Patescibacteria group bacterium]MBU1895867.1 helix-turn-helix domain-containing protein [Patescibacteria group bacterium]
MRQWEKTIKSLGFTESEAQIYLTSLELGPSPVQAVAKEAGVSRVTAYSAIEALMNEGLMSTVEKGKKKLYAAEPPERLVSVANAKAKAIENTAKEVESSIGELKLIERGEKPVVRVFEGPEALKTIMDDVVRSRPTELFEFGNLNEIRRVYGKDKNLSQVFIDFFEKLDISQTKRKMVYLADEEPNTRSKYEEFFVLGKGNDFLGDVIVFGNKVVLSNFTKDRISVLIESEVIARTIQAMIKAIWQLKKKK